MKIISKLSILMVLCLGLACAKETVILTPDRTLTISVVEKVAGGEADVIINSEAIGNIVRGYEVVMQAALNDKPVYGLE